MSLEVFTLRNCDFCRELKESLDLEKIDYTEVQIEKDWRVRLKLEDDHGVKLEKNLEDTQKKVSSEKKMK